MERSDATYVARNSSFELLRIIAQYMIVIYHVLLFWFIHRGIEPIHVYKAVCIPLHIGVISYVLISGYYGIRFSLKGVLKIIANLLVYGLLLSLVGHFWLGDEFGVKELCFVSNSPFWFVKAYLMLYLAAPLVNKMIRGISVNNRLLLLLLLLLWASCFVGFLGFDDSLQGGKNLIHFILLYLIGNTLVLYKDRINQIPLHRIILGYVLVNALSISMYQLCIGSKLEGISYAFAFQYNSPILILNAVLFFIPFMRMYFCNRTINYLASSCFAVYLIHSSLLFLNHPIKAAALYIQTLSDNVTLIVLMVCVLSLLIMLGCIMMDKLLFPYWKFIDWFTTKLNKSKLGDIAVQWANQ